MPRRLRRPTNRTDGTGRRQRGSTLIEILVGVSLLGIVMVPLGMATITAWHTIFGIQQKLSSSADAQLLGATFPADVQSAGATGVNPTDPVNANTCAVRAEDGETPLIMFVWDEDLGVSNQRVARYLAKGSGSDSQIIRRFCKGTASSQDVVVARNFGLEGIQEASLFTLGDNGLTSPQCTATDCYIQISGEYNFRLKVDRRVPGSAPGAFVPDAPTNVHAIGSNNRATVYWTDPSDNGAAITGYYLEQTPGGAVLGPFATDGITGAQVNGLTNSQSYTFRVRAVNVLGPGPYSAPTGAVTPGPSTPDAPVIGTATPDPAVNGKAAVTWTIPAGYNNGGSAIVGYKVYAQHAPDAPIVVDVSDPAALSSTVTGLADNTTYGLRVSARNAYGESSPSASSNVVLTLPGPPGTPTAVFTGVPNSVDVTFALPASGDFTSFTNFRAHIIETSTYTTPVVAATACPGTAPTTCTLTVTGIGSAQSYSIKVQAQNATGWGPESGAVLNVDLTAPVVTITTPSTTFVNSATPTVGGVAGALPGDLPTITVKVYAGATATGSPVQTTTTTASGTAWSVALNPALTAGQYTAIATQKDSTGNTGTSNTKTFTIDTVAPTGSITAPNANAWVRGAVVTVSSSSADALSGVASADFQYSPAGANTWTSIETDTSSPYSISWDTTYLTDGAYDLRVITTDNAVNTFTSPIRTVKSDNTVPVPGVPLASGTLGSNGWYKGTVTVTWPTQPTDAYSGIASTTGCGTTTISSDTTGQVVTCSATDNAGNTSSNSITIKKDATAPTAATLNAMGSFITNGKVLTGTGTDATSGIDSITYLYCSGAACTPATIVIGSSSAAGTYPVTWNSMPANGAYRVIARVFDAAGNSRDSTLTSVTIDTTAPTGNITAPAANAWVRQSPSVTSNSADASSGVLSVTFQYSVSGANSWTTIATDNATPFTTLWNTTLVTDGPYDLRAITQDNAGNSFTSANVTVKVDNTAPTIVAPSVSGTLGTNGWYTSSVVVTWPTPATDAYSGIASTSGCGTTNVVADTAGQVVTCSATDNAGNTAPSTVTIKRDATIPSSATLVAMTSIAEGKVLTGSGADAISGVNDIAYLYCQGATCTPNIEIGSSTTASTYPVTWNAMPADGSYRVMSQVTDKAGNTRDSTIQTVTIDNTAPTVTSMVMQDTNNNGKVNKVLVTFNETLASYTAGTTPWTLTNVPSSGTISTVTVSGAVATVNIAEGSGAKDTAVGNFKLALASSAIGIRDALGNRSSFGATAPTDGAKPVPVTVVLSNKAGNTAGKAEIGDFATITYSETLSVVSACTTWSNDANNQSASVTATITNNAAIDPLTLGAPCANFGTLNLNGDYVSSTRTFSSTTAAWDVAAEALTITLGTPSSSVNTGVGSAVPTYSPTASLKDPAGNTMPITSFSGTSSRF
jgi:hypothetical protein